MATYKEAKTHISKSPKNYVITHYGIITTDPPRGGTPFKLYTHYERSVDKLHEIRSDLEDLRSTQGRSTGEYIVARLFELLDYYAPKPSPPATDEELVKWLAKEARRAMNAELATLSAEEVYDVLFTRKIPE